MPTITITGDTTQEALEQVLYQGMGKYGKDFNVHISENLRFENQNKEIKELKKVLAKLQDDTFIRMDKKMLDKFKKFCKQEATKR